MKRVLCNLLMASLLVFTACESDPMLDDIKPANTTKVGESIDAIYISMDGVDTNNGGELFPVQTLTRAMELLDGDANGTGEDKDTILIREGEYRFEEIIKDHKSRLTIAAYPGEKVVVSGLEEVTSEWTQVNAECYKTTPNIKMWQLFQDGKMLNLARTPDAGCFIEDDLSQEELATKGLWNSLKKWYDCSSSTTEGHIIGEGGFPYVKDVSFKGAIAVMNIGSWKTTYSYVTEHTAGSNNFDYHIDMTYPYVGTFYKYAGNSKFYLEGMLEFLNAKGEWHYDVANNELYVRCKDDENPNDLKIQGKTQTYAIQMYRCANIALSNLTFYGTTVYAEESDNIKVLNSNLLYPSYSRRILRDIEGVDEGGTTHMKNDNYIHVTTFNGCKNLEFTNNVVKYSEGEALFCGAMLGKESKAERLSGRVDSKAGSSMVDTRYGVYDGTVNDYTNHMIRNNVFQSIDFTCANLHDIGSSIVVFGKGNSFIGNTIAITGASDALHIDRENYVANNDFSRIGLVQNDGVAIQMRPPGSAQSVITGNYFHDFDKYSVRIDNGGSGNMQGWVPDGVMTSASITNNIMWNCGGICLKGDYHLVSNNTLGGYYVNQFRNEVVPCSVMVFRNSGFDATTGDKPNPDIDITDPDEYDKYYDSNSHTYCFNNLSELIAVYEDDKFGFPETVFNNYANYYKYNKFVSSLMMDPENGDYRPIYLKDYIVNGENGDKVSADVDGVIDNGKEPEIDYGLEDFVTYEKGDDNDPLDIGAVSYNDEEYTIAGYRAAVSTSPIPMDGGVSSASVLMLAWKPAWDTNYSSVYVGLTEDSVLNATVEDNEYQGLTREACFYPLKSHYPFSKRETKYYWRVDCMVDGVMVKGDVWEFSTVPVI